MKRDSKLFFPRFTRYARLLRKGQPMPLIFQQAAYLFGTLENKPDLDKFPFDKSVKTTYNAFMREAVKYDNQPVQVGRLALYPFFGSTYFYDYYYGVRN